MARLAGLSSPGGTIKMVTTLANHFNQFRGEHSILRNTDRHNVTWFAQSTATRMDLAAGAFDS
jgi:hypothetical protein